MFNFTKMHGLGNDYVYIFVENEKDIDFTKLARKVSNRNFGIGSDGLIVISKNKNSNFKMRIFNSDGSEGAMCGNGIRCVAKYLYDNKYVTTNKFDIDTKSGIKHVSIKVNKDNLVERVQVNMGKVKFKDVKKIEVLDKTFEVNLVDVGNIHGVIFTRQNVFSYAEKYGELISKHKCFNHDINVEFVKVVNDETIKMAVYERGSGITLACGTGACASYFAAHKKEMVKNSGTVILNYGNLDILVDSTDIVFMSGEAVKVFDGTFYD